MLNKKINVLLIDADPNDLKYIQIALNQSQYLSFDVTIAENISSAYDYLNKKNFDIILLDSSLPDSNGLDSISKISCKTPNIAIIMITELNDEEVGVQALQKGAEDYLIKGPDINKLLIRSIRYAIERKKIIDAIKDSEIKYSTLVEMSSDGIIMIQNGKIIFTNQKIKEMTEYYDDTEIANLNFLDEINEKQKDKALERFMDIMTGKDIKSYFQLQIKKKNGLYLWVEINSNFIKYNKQPTILVFIRDINTRIKSEVENIRLAAFPRESPNPILSCTPDGNIDYINPAAQHLIEKLKLRSSKKLLPDNHNEIIELSIKNNQYFQKIEVEINNQVLSWTYNPIISINTIHLHAINITDQKRAEKKLLHEAFHDSLTGLPNRNLFIDRLKQAIKASQRNYNDLFAVLYMDLDRFKTINDSLGHIIGDKLLIAISHKLKRCIRSIDTVARFGGDEFTILLTKITDISDAISVINRIHEVLSKHFNIDGHDIYTKASIGLTLSTTKYTNPEEILRDADIAMYRAKSQGKSRYELFDKEMHRIALKQMQMETDLRYGIKRQEFFLLYQPIVSLENYKITGFESLLRWQHPKLGLIPPIEFIPLAEETGHIIQIGKWVIHQSCIQMQKMKKASNNESLYISINLSVKQLAQSNLITQINKIIEETGIDTHNLTLEITESMLMENNQTINSLLLKLRDRKVNLSIDDFGTGYSSLSYLHSFPFQTLKIDRSFINLIKKNNERTEIVQAIINLAHNLHMKLIAEGIENVYQLNQLKSMGCEYAQGYLFSRPIDSETALRMITEDKQWKEFTES